VKHDFIAYITFMQILSLTSSSDITNFNIANLFSLD